jgi:hypothetical protein
MPKQETNTAIELAESIRTVDDARATSDPFKLPPVFRALLDERYNRATQAEEELQSVSGNRTRSAAQKKLALESLVKDLKSGFNHIKAVPSFSITAEERKAVFTAYGWSGAKLGTFQEQSRVLSLARQAIAITPEITPVKAQYPADLIAHMRTQLEILTDAEPNAGTGARQQATQDRDTATNLLYLAIARTRFFYCFASDDVDKTPQLARIKRQPRRVSGQRRVKSEPAPSKPEA